MKKLITLLFLSALTIVGATAYGQDKTLVFNENQPYTKVTFAAADTISKNDNLYSLVFYPSQHYPLTQDVLIKITKVSGTPRIAVKLQAKKMDGTHWLLLSTTLLFAIISGAAIYDDNKQRNVIKEIIKKNGLSLQWPTTVTAKLSDYPLT